MKAAAQGKATLDSADMSPGMAVTPAPQQTKATKARGSVCPTLDLPRKVKNLSLGEESPSYKMSASNVRTKHLQAGSQTRSGKAHRRTHGAKWNTKEILKAVISDVTDGISN